jgi:tetratricopeptide (TPR) repeat protein
MLSRSTFDQQLDDFCQSDKFRAWQERLTDCFYDKGAKDNLIHEVREAVVAQMIDLSTEEVEALQRAVIERLVGLASRAAKRPQYPEEPPPPTRSARELVNLIREKFPYPIACCYRRLIGERSSAATFGCLLDTFESLLHYLATVVLSAYWRDGAPEPDHNRRLLEKFYKANWGPGDLMELLRETAKLYLDRPGALPYPQLIGYLFTRRGELSPSLKVLEGFVELRNRAWGHGAGRDDRFYANILPQNRQRLDEELSRCNWLTTQSLWLPKAIEDDGQVTFADLLNGDICLAYQPVSLQLDPNDLDINGGDVVPEQTLLLVNEETGGYLPLFPLSLFHFQKTGQGVFFLNERTWAAKSELLKKAHYLAYDPLLDKYETRAGEPAVRNLEAKVHLMEKPVQQSDEEERRRELPREIIVGLRFANVGEMFKNRKDKLTELRERLRDQTAKFICITGRGGIGKTALLSKVCTEIESGELRLSDTATAMGADGIIYVSCRGVDKPMVERLYHDVRQVLGSPHDEALMDCWRDASRSLVDKVRFLLSKLRAGCYLLVLDNFEDVLAPDNTIDDTDLREFVDLCLTTPNALRLIVTSRERVVIGGHGVRAVRTVPLDSGLPNADGIVLLRDLDPDGELGLRDAPDELLQDATRQCYGVPRALESIAGILSSNPTLNLAQLLGDTALFNEQVVENLIAEHYRLVTDDQQRVLEALAVYNKPVPADAVRYLLEPFYPNVDVDTCLRILALNYFVTYQRGRDTYELHPIDQQHAYARIPDEDGDYTKRALHHRAAEFYMSRAEEVRAGRTITQRVTWDMFAQVQWVESVGQAIEYFFAAEAWQDLVQAHEAIKEFYLAWLEWGYIQECADMCQRMLHAARSVDNKSEEAEWLHDWAVLNQHSGNYTVAEQSCLKGLEIARRLEGKKMLQAHFLHRLGRVMEDQGNCEQAKKWYEQSARLKEKLEGPVGAYPTWSRYAILLENEGNLDQALELQKNALELASQGNDYWGGLRFRFNLARILRKRGNYIEAENMCLEAMRLARQSDSKNYLAIILLEAGCFALGKKEYDKAQEFLCESEEVAAYPDNKAQVFHALGMLNHLLGNLADASRYYEDAFTFDLPETKYSSAIRLGILCLEEGKAEEAQDYFTHGIALCRELLEKTPRLYDVLYHLALAQLSTGQSDEALATYRKALEVCSAKGVVQGALQDLELLRRAAPHVMGVTEAIALLERDLEAS